MKRISLTREEFRATLKEASENVRKWPPLRNSKGDRKMNTERRICRYDRSELLDATLRLAAADHLGGIQCGAWNPDGTFRNVAHAKQIISAVNAECAGWRGDEYYDKNNQVIGCVVAQAVDHNGKPHSHSGYRGYYEGGWTGGDAGITRDAAMGWVEAQAKGGGV